MREQPVPRLRYPVSSYTECHSDQMHTCSMQMKCHDKTSLSLSEILNSITTHCLWQQLLQVEDKIVKAVQICFDTNLCKFLVSDWHRQREQGCLVFNRGSNISLFPSRVEGDRQPGSTHSLPSARPSFGRVGSPTNLPAQTTKPSSFLLCRERWENCILKKRLDIYERNHKRVILAHNIFHKRETQKQSHVPREASLQLTTAAVCKSRQTHLRFTQ